MKKLLIVICLLVSFAGLEYATAQNSTENEPVYGKIGAGIAFQPFSFASLLDEGSMVPVGGINLAFNITEQFRLEADLGYMNVDNKTNDDKTSLFNSGIGFLFAMRKESSAIMAGIKADYTTGTNEFKGGLGTTYTNKINGITFGPVLAYEYFMSKNFSVGGEVGLKIRNFKEEADEDLNTSDDELEINSTFMHNAIYLRAYF